MIMVSDNFGIETDGDLNFMLMKKFNKREKVDGKWQDTGETDMKCIGWYPSFKQCLKDLCEKELMDTKFKDMETINKKFDELNERIDKLKEVI
ncbi:hypothetical protein [Peptostreptococcus porci]|uniref:hypothetical protein n=1 Tax=Peptostreptococcus porci TaxID=2652282 RepID=UPI002A81FE18|nr:hypothetical protein [Peptostreptococcus porci]MDY4127727.1 hypothetical protein [Peptostreptococcus porci]